MANVRNTWKNTTIDPYATTTDSSPESWRVQSVSKGGEDNDAIVDSAANFPVVTPTRFFVELPQAIDVTDLTGSKPIVITDETSSTTLTRVTGTPAANQFRIPPENSKRRASIEVHSGQAGNTLSFDYYGNGSIPDAKEMNQISWCETIAKTGDYAITDTDRIETLQCSTSAVGDITITLPTVADNKGREIYIYKDHANGKVTVDAEGAEKIGDNDSEYLFSKWDYIKVQSDGTQWIIKSMYSHIDTGWISRSDWTNVRIGTAEVDYDSSSGTFIDGEVITGGTSSDSGIIHNPSSITFTLRNVTSNGTLFTNNEVITGSISGATALVNEGSGTAKNLDSNFYHGYGLDLSDIKNSGLSFLISSDGSENNSRIISLGHTRTADHGLVPYQVDSNNLLFQAGNTGLCSISPSGLTLTIDGEDWYYKIIWERKI